MKFNSIKALQEHIRINGTPDTFVYEKDPYTMIHYDLEGKEIIYRCDNNSDIINVLTANRYSEKKFTDAIVEWLPF